MGDPINPINFGGAKFDENQVKSKRTEKTDDGKTVYIVDFKAGGTVKYPCQSDKNRSSIFLETGISLEDSPIIDYNIRNFHGLEFVGSNERDFVKLLGSNNCTIKVDNDRSNKDAVLLKDNGNFESFGNKVLMDNDVVRERGNRVEGRGTHREGASEKDFE